MNQEQLIEAMRKDLEAYKTDNKSAKPLSTTMREIAEWLQAKEK